MTFIWTLIPQVVHSRQPW